ncbi:MAG: hypothetical protein MUF87_07435 [Anaerolineae bacterium]|nr:hypothetical protein [Anaerolineae bacterium]
MKDHDSTIREPNPDETTGLAKVNLIFGGFLLFLLLIVFGLVLFPALTREARATATPLPQFTPTSMIQLTPSPVSTVLITTTVDRAIRSGDALDFPEVAVFPAGASAVITGVNRSGTWLFIEYQGDRLLRGWILRDEVEINGDLAAIRVIDTGTP